MPLMESKTMMMMTTIIIQHVSVKFTTIYYDSLCKIDLNLDLMFCTSFNLHEEREMKESDISDAIFFSTSALFLVFIFVCLFLFVWFCLMLLCSVPSHCKCFRFAVDR